VKEVASSGGATTSSLPGGSLSAMNFDKTEWEIMYPLFIESGLVAPLSAAMIEAGVVLYFVLCILIPMVCLYWLQEMFVLTSSDLGLLGTLFLLKRFVFRFCEILSPKSFGGVHFYIELLAFLRLRFF
jgi:hypothetical protein